MKRIVFCLPGPPTMNNAISWDDLRSAFAERPDLDMTIVRAGGSSIVHVRNDILEHGVTGPKKTCRPFGDMEYDFMMWIDSDSVYTPQDFFKLLEMDVDIATGIVPIDLEPGRAAAGKIDLAKGETAYLRLATLGLEPFEVDWCGFAFLLVKRDVFESLSYPWFDLHHYDVGDQIIYPSEDIRWCLRVRENGYRIIAHPMVRVDHEKRLIIQAPDPRELFVDRYDHAWRMSKPAREAIRDLMIQFRPKKVLELGPGASSFVILPLCLERGALYRALDHKGPYYDKHLVNLRDAGLPTESTLAVYLDTANAWYLYIPEAIEKEAPYDMVVVDGPVKGRASPLALAAYDRWGRDKTIWVIDDVGRLAEWESMKYIARDRYRIQIIKDPDYPRRTAVLLPKEGVDENLAVLDTISENDEAEVAVGQPASRGQPEAIA